MVPQYVTILCIFGIKCQHFCAGCAGSTVGPPTSPHLGSSDMDVAGAPVGAGDYNEEGPQSHVGCEARPFVFLTGVEVYAAESCLGTLYVVVEHLLMVHVPVDHHVGELLGARLAGTGSHVTGGGIAGPDAPRLVV